MGENRTAPAEMTTPFPHWLLATLIVSGCAAIVLLLRFPSDSAYYWGITGNHVDMHVYRWGGNFVRVHLPLYEGEVHPLGPGDQARAPMPFTYSPFAALLFVPLGALSIRVMEDVWTFATLASAAVIAWKMFEWLGYRRDRRLVWASVAVAATVLFTEPFRMTLWLGQINVLLLLLLVVDAATPWSRWRGLGTGIAAGIKLTPGFLWLHYAVTRQWRYVLTGVAGFVGSIALGAVAAPRSSWHYWSGGLLDADRIGGLDAPSNQSANGVLAHYVFGNVSPPVWAWALGAAACSAVGLYASSRAHRAGEPQLAFVLSGMTGCMASPFSWGHHWVWFLPLMVVVLHLVRIHARSGCRRALWIFPLALYFLVGAWVEYFPWEGQPDGVWVATGWFMSSPALSGPFSTLLREPYVVVWLSTVVAALVLSRSPRSGYVSNNTGVIRP